MIAGINTLILVAATLCTLFFYVKSVGPAALEKRIGPVAYARCTRYRFIAGLCMGIATINYLIYFFYPLPVPLPRTLPWAWWISVLIAAMIAVPSGYLFWRGMRDAGEETMIVKKEHGLYGGIYERIRHPQTLGEMPFWWVLAFLLHSSFLVLYSFVWVPVFLIMCWAEERDLVIRYGEAYREYQRSTGFMVPKRQ